MRGLAIKELLVNAQGFCLVVIQGRYVVVEAFEAGCRGRPILQRRHGLLMGLKQQPGEFNLVTQKLLLKLQEIPLLALHMRQPLLKRCQDA
jgi:hypothetical protein